jgi:Ion channel
MKPDILSITWYLGSVVATVVLHSIGSVLIVTERPRMFGSVPQRGKVVLAQFVIMIVVSELLILHVIEIGFWGLCLHALGLFASLKSALYFAGISYTSLGYSGALPSPRIGFAEVLIAMIGLLMFGWSIGILVTTVIQYERLTLGFDPLSYSPEKPRPE